MISLPVPVSLDLLPEADHGTYDLEEEIIKEQLARKAADWWAGDVPCPEEYSAMRVCTLEEFIEAVLLAA